MHIVRIATVRNALTLAALLALALLALLALTTLPAHAANQSVSITGFTFSPATVNVNVGDSVTWTQNDSGVQHTVTSDTGAFGSPELQPGQTFSRTFAQAGSFAYHCEIHTGIRGTVVVAAVAATTPAAGVTTAPPAVGTGLAGGQSSLPILILMGGMAVILGASALAVVRVRART